VSLDDRLLLLDTGMGSHPAVDAHSRPARRQLAAALGEVGCRLMDLDPRRVLFAHDRSVWEP